MIVAAMQVWAEEYGEPPAVPDWAAALARDLGDEERARRYEAMTDVWPSHSTVFREFGSWNAAVEAAGFTPRPAHGGGGNELRSRRRRALTGE
jgi:hypothetical protein